MVVEAEESTIIGKAVLLKGFLAGSLFLLSFFVNIDMALKALIFLYGIVALLDGLLPSKQEQYYPMSLFAGLLIGFVLSIIFYSYLGFYYLYFIVVVATLMYLYRIFEKSRQRKAAPPPAATKSL